VSCYAACLWPLRCEDTDPRRGGNSSRDGPGEDPSSRRRTLSLSVCAVSVSASACLRLFIARGVVCERTKIPEGIFFALSLRKPSYIWTATRRARYKSCVTLSLSLSLSYSSRSRRRVEIKHSSTGAVYPLLPSGTEVPRIVDDSSSGRAGGRLSAEAPRE